MSNEGQYRDWFGLGQPRDEGKAARALQYALDIRKYEIDLYWRRAGYFWTLIATAFAGYFAILGAQHLAHKEYLAFIVGCVGALFNWAWFLVNRGSKMWQENWENHVDMLEDSVAGPLYKTLLYRRDPKNRWDAAERSVTGPAFISVSKVNQIASLFTLCIWIALIWHALPWSDLSVNVLWRYVAVAALALAFGSAMVKMGKTSLEDHEHQVFVRKTKII